MSGRPGRRIAIVGGGISGLAAAWRLQQQSRERGLQLDITVLEADERLGGKLRTDHPDGLVVEAGPDSFLSYKPAAIQLARELGIEDRIISTRETGGGTFILSDGRLEPLPEGITMLVPTKLRPLLRSRLLSMRGKLRMAADYLIPARQTDEDESIGSFTRRRLGDEAFERMVQPLLSGIYAGDADELSLAATFPRLREVERQHGGLLRGMLAQRRDGSSQQPRAASAFSPFVSFSNGMGELIDALVEQLGDVRLRTGTVAQRIEKLKHGYLVNIDGDDPLEVDAVLLATPAYVTADLVEGLDGEMAALLRRIPYVSTATVTLAYRVEDVQHLQDGRGFVIPHREGRELTAVTWASNKFAGRAPDDVAVVRAFVGRAGREEAVDLPDRDLLQLVRDELRDILGIGAKPFEQRLFCWRRAMPQYNVGHTDRVAEIERRSRRHLGIELLGAAYRGVGIPDCIESGYRASDQTLAELRLETTGHNIAPAATD